jgi:hypothetical protein
LSVIEPFFFCVRLSLCFVVAGHGSWFTIR